MEFYDQKRKLSSSSNDASIKFWDIEKGVCTNTLKEHVAFVWGLTFNEYSNVAISCSVDTTIRIWDCNATNTKTSSLSTKGNCIQIINNPMNKEFAGIAVDWNANKLVGSSFDGFVRVWDLRTYKRIPILS